MSTLIPPHRIRQAKPSDLNFIRDSWLKGHGASAFSKYMPKREVYFKNHTPIVNGILDRASVLLCVNPEDLDQIFSYMVFEIIGNAMIIHFIYTKDVYRKLGLASILIDSIRKQMFDPSIMCTHSTECFPFLREKFGIIYNPYLIWGHHEGSHSQVG